VPPPLYRRHSPGQVSADRGRRLRTASLTLVSPDRAMRDLVYSLPDDPLDPNGDDWL